MGEVWIDARKPVFLAHEGNERGKVQPCLLGVGLGGFEVVDVVSCRAGVDDVEHVPCVNVEVGCGEKIVAEEFAAGPHKGTASGDFFLTWRFAKDEQLRETRVRAAAWRAAHRQGKVRCLLEAGRGELHMHLFLEVGQQ